MTGLLDYFWRHPRRTGFIALNVVVLLAFVAWAMFTSEMTREGVGALPSVILGYTGLVLLSILWIGAWLAWGWFVVTRQLRHRQ